MPLARPATVPRAHSVISAGATGAIWWRLPLGSATSRRTAVASNTRLNRLRSTGARTRLASKDPVITPAAAPGTIADAAQSSRLCSPAYIAEATTEIGSTAAIVVPLAAARAIPTFRDVSTGTMTTPPATPSSPHSTPAAAPPTPRTAVRLSSRQCLIRATRPVLKPSDAMSASFRLDRHRPGMRAKGSLADPGCTFLAAFTGPAGPVTDEVVTAAVRRLLVTMAPRSVRAKAMTSGSESAAQPAWSLLSDLAVGELADDVEVADVAGVLLDQ